MTEPKTLSDWEIKIKRCNNGFLAEYLEEALSDNQDSEPTYIKQTFLFEDGNLSEFNGEEIQILKKMKSESVAFLNLLFFLKDHFAIYDQSIQLSQALVDSEE